MQFHMEQQPFTMPYSLISTQEYQTYEQLEQQKERYWGGVGTTPVQCPSWAIISLDHMGRVKQPCCIGSADSNKGSKPICEQCGLGCYSVLVAQGIKGN